MNEHVAIRPPADAYGVDVYAWTRAQVDLMRAGRLELLDIHNIAEEIESFGNEQEHGVESHLVILGEHLIKLLVSADQDPRHGGSRCARRVAKSAAA